MRQLRHEIRKQSKEEMLEALEGYNADKHVYDSLGNTCRMITKAGNARLQKAMKVICNIDTISTEGALLEWEAIVGYLEGAKEYMIRHSRDS